MDKLELINEWPTYAQHTVLWAETGWPLVGEELFKKIVSGTDDYVTARIEERVVGIARMVGDGVMYGYIQDVIVHSPLRRRGIGRAMIEHLLDRARIKNVRFVGLFSTINAISFYQELKFSRLDNNNVGLGMYFTHK